MLDCEDKINDPVLHPTSIYHHGFGRLAASNWITVSSNSNNPTPQISSRVSRLRNVIRTVIFINQYYFFDSISFINIML